jgi:UDP-N-acetylglucosamine--N-acetylmuramyl-(pentapeptide) pyrophosphoryl-undecaprenol N-acetylglucosamine transferase
MQRIQPDAAFVTGGYVAAPVVLAARLQRVPVLVYLPDLHPGWAIRAMSAIVQRIAVTSPTVMRHFSSQKAVVTGYPVRQSFRSATREEAREHFGLSPTDTVLLVTGGSRGAHSLNRAIASCIEETIQRWQVIHITGALDYEASLAKREGLSQEVQERYKVFDYLHEEMALAMAAADLVLARAGASVMGEFPALGLPSILVPYPHAGGHQELNAAYLVQHGAAVRVSDDDLQSELPGLLRQLATDTARLQEMSNRARELDCPGAARALAKQITDLAASGTRRE